MPGSGLFESHLLVGVVFVVLAVGATIAWLQWGTDWLVLGVWLGSMVVTAVVAHTGHATPSAAVPGTRASHEFPLVMVVVGALTWLRTVVGGLPGMRQLRRRFNRSHPDRLRLLSSVGTVEASQAAAIAALAHPTPDQPGDPRLSIVHAERRLRRRAIVINICAGGRFRGDPLRRDHAHGRAALALSERCGDDCTGARHDARARTDSDSTPPTGCRG